jgi:O-antigen/teichoic acid export membrane protein
VLGRIRSHTVALSCICDQGITSAGNFALNIYLARNCAVEEFGVFAVLFTTVIFLNSIHGALVVYPLTIECAKTSPGANTKAVYSAVVLTILLAIPFSIVLASACVLLSRPDVAIWVVLSGLLWQVQEVVRRGLTSQLRFLTALPGDLLSYVGQVVLVSLAFRVGTFDLGTVFQAMCISSALAAALQAVQLGIVRGRPSFSPEFFRYSWRVGKWATLTALLAGVISTQFVIWLMSTINGAGQAAGVQAISTIVGLTHPILASLGVVVIPAAAKVREAQGVRSAVYAVGKHVRPAMILLTIYLAFVVVCPTLILTIFFGPKSSFLGFATPLRLLAWAYLLNSIGQSIGGILKAFEDSHGDSMMNLESAIIMLVLAIPAACWYGVTGCMWVLAATATWRTARLACFAYARHWKTSAFAQQSVDAG